mmetsp:Transcript_105115/g.314010  ORF Transcript_105115/g.314010 Transcript_105115/m.314010 type:complete len:213 (-) Transcript_105115:418-1056(-)
MVFATYFFNDWLLCQTSLGRYFLTAWAYPGSVTRGFSRKSSLVKEGHRAASVSISSTSSTPFSSNSRLSSATMISISSKELTPPPSATRERNLWHRASAAHAPSMEGMSTKLRSMASKRGKRSLNASRDCRGLLPRSRLLSHSAGRASTLSRAFSDKSSETATLASAGSAGSSRCPPSLARTCAAPAPPALHSFTLSKTWSQPSPVTLPSAS